MLDDIMDRVRRGAERVQRRGEEVAQTTRLRLEVFQLTRELDTLYARLGRSYHAGAETGVLQTIQEDIRRVDEEIGARERLIEELNVDQPPEQQAPEGPQETPSGTVVRVTAQPTAPQGPMLEQPVPTGATEPTVPDAMPRPDQPRPEDKPTSPDSTKL